METIKLFKKLLTLIIIITVVLISGTTNAQKYNRSRSHWQSNGSQTKNFRFGLEASVSAPQLHFKSNLEEFNNLSIDEEGMTGGLLIGIKGIDLRIRRGYFSSSETMSKRVDMITTEGALNIYPLQFLSRRARFWEPYIVTAIEKNDLKMYGISQAKPITSTQATSKKCHNEPPADPDLVDPDLTHKTAHSEEPISKDPKYIGTLNVTKATFGGGIVLHVYGKRTFINFFTEYKLGTSINIRPTELMLIHTSVKESKTITVGINFGLH